MLDTAYCKCQLLLQKKPIKKKINHLKSSIITSDDFQKKFDTNSINSKRRVENILKNNSSLDKSLTPVKNVNQDDYLNLYSTLYKEEKFNDFSNFRFFNTEVKRNLSLTKSDKFFHHKEKKHLKCSINIKENNDSHNYFKSVLKTKEDLNNLDKKKGDNSKKNHNFRESQKKIKKPFINCEYLCLSTKKFLNPPTNEFSINIYQSQKKLK